MPLARSNNSFIETRLRIVALALKPALTISRVMALPLDDLQALVAIGLYKDARARGMSHPAIAKRFGKSLRTIAWLSKQVRRNELGAQPTRQLEVRRRVIELVPRRKFVKIAQVAAIFSAREQAIALDEIEQLVTEGVYERKNDTIRSLLPFVALTSEELSQRLAAVEHFFSIVTQVLHQRFFTMPNGAHTAPEAFARSLSFQASREDLVSLRKELYDHIQKKVTQVDERADSGVKASLAFCLVEAPTERSLTPS